MQTKGPQGPRFALKTLMSKNEVRIYGCARARLTAFTLLYNLIGALAISEKIIVKYIRTQKWIFAVEIIQEFCASVHIFDILTSYRNIWPACKSLELSTARS